MVIKMDDVKTSLAELDRYTRQRVVAAIGLCRKRKQRVSLPHDVNGDVYAYPDQEPGKTCWGVNGGPNGFCIARGIE